MRRPRDLDARTLAELTGEHLKRFHDLSGEPFPQNPLDQVEAAVRGRAEVLGRAEGARVSPPARPARRRSARRSSCSAWCSATPAACRARASASPVTPLPASGDPTSSSCPTRRARTSSAAAARKTEPEQLALLAPEVHQRLDEVCRVLEAEFRDAQEFEFTVQDGELFLLQTRTAKRTPWAALRTAVDQVQEGLVSSVEARERLAGLDLEGIRRTHVRHGEASRRDLSGPAGEHGCRKRSDRSRRRGGRAHRARGPCARADTPRHQHRGSRGDDRRGGPAHGQRRAHVTRRRRRARAGQAVRGGRHRDGNRPGPAPRRGSATASLPKGTRSASTARPAACSPEQCRSMRNGRPTTSRSSQAGRRPEGSAVEIERKFLVTRW